MAIWADAVDVVNRVSDRHGNEVRCHELARAASKALFDLNRRKLAEAGAELVVVDGRLWSIDHSWVQIVEEQGSWRHTAGMPIYREFRKRFILDVYCPGRAPQVQLLDGDHFAIARGYEVGTMRTDVDLIMVERLTREMQR